MYVASILLLPLLLFLLLNSLALFFVKFAAQGLARLESRTGKRLVEWSRDLIVALAHALSHLLLLRLLERFFQNGILRYVFRLELVVTVRVDS